MYQLTTCDCDFPWCSLGLKVPSSSPLLRTADFRWAGRALLNFDAMLRDYGENEEGVSVNHMIRSSESLVGHKKKSHPECSSSSRPCRRGGDEHSQNSLGLCEGGSSEIDCSFQKQTHCIEKETCNVGSYIEIWGTENGGKGKGKGKGQLTRILVDQGPGNAHSN